jgi:hypothetical protein
MAALPFANSSDTKLQGIEDSKLTPNVPGGYDDSILINNT